ncbi:biopolymer transporter ExbD (plasmid) [Burkholderia sp. FERM BP-3421]|nr:biopolymer transporter ExbD [Burkholderia sp. FERM BP-3421]WDD90359.1 biopolymer transporter ExbD [Burkholderia sp. FERM BP-3421]
MSEINMTPLIDVMLVLLIVFMITLPAITNAVKIDLPKEISTPNETKSAHVEVSIDAGGAIHWDAAIVDQATLQTRLKEAAERQTQPEIQLYADRMARYERVADLLSAIQRAGLSKIDFVTQPQP